MSAGPAATAGTRPGTAAVLGTAVTTVGAGSRDNGSGPTPRATSGSPPGRAPGPNGMYGVDFAEIYDLLYAARGKDFAAEAELVAQLIRDRRPVARALLDVGCGTGAHLAHFARMFVHVQGVDLSEAMLAVARRNLPTMALHRGDMRTFALGHRFDAVVCMFATIAHQRSTADLTATLRRFGRHLWPGGLVVVDPWWFPETFLPGYVAAEIVTPDGRTIARVSHARRVGHESRTEVHYVVADPAHGVRHFTETYRHTLFSRLEYETALREAGFRPEYVPEVQAGRGLFVGIWEGGSAA